MAALRVQTLGFMVEKSVFTGPIRTVFGRKEVTL